MNKIRKLSKILQIFMKFYEILKIFANFAEIFTKFRENLANFLNDFVKLLEISKNPEKWAYSRYRRRRHSWEMNDWKLEILLNSAKFC